MNRKREATILAAFTFAGLAGVAAIPCACIDNNSNILDSGPTEAPGTGACWGADNVFCYAWKDVPPSSIDSACAEPDSGAGGIGTCPMGDGGSPTWSGVCTTIVDDAGSTSLTSYSPVTSCTAAKASCAGTFVGNGC